MEAWKLHITGVVINNTKGVVSSIGCSSKCPHHKHHKNLYDILNSRKVFKSLAEAPPFWKRVYKSCQKLEEMNDEEEWGTYILNLDNEIRTLRRLYDERKKIEQQIHYLEHNAGN